MDLNREIIMEIRTITTTIREGKRKEITQEVVETTMATVAVDDGAEVVEISMATIDLCVKFVGKEVILLLFVFIDLIEFVPNSVQNRNNAPNVNQTPGNNQPVTVYMANSHNPFIANYEPVLDPNWYANSGASNHVTGDYTNLINPKEYGGKKHVVIGNGEQLPISFIGKTYLSDGCTTLNLENILFVPDIAKNLISVSKLAQDNNIYFEFHGDFCLIKAKESSQVVLRGVLKDKLYQLDNVTSLS